MLSAQHTIPIGIIAAQVLLGWACTLHPKSFQISYLRSACWNYSSGPRSVWVLLSARPAHHSWPVKLPLCLASGPFSGGFFPGPVGPCLFPAWPFWGWLLFSLSLWALLVETNSLPCPHLLLSFPALCWLWYLSAWWLRGKRKQKRETVKSRRQNP